MIRQLPFKANGVLINSEPLHEFTLQELSSQFGRRFESKAELQQFKGLPEVSIAELFKKIFPNLSLGAAEITSATYQMIQPRLTLAAHLFVMACAHVL